jgi:hypothetical protein
LIIYFLKTPMLNCVLSFQAYTSYKGKYDEETHYLLFRTFLKTKRNIDSLRFTHTVLLEVTDETLL